MTRLPAETRARQLGATADALTDLAEDIDPELDHIRGRPDAPVTLVEYGDFECPYCVRAAPVIEELLERFTGELRYVFRHLPAERRAPQRPGAAEASEAAAEQGAFWEMRDRLLDNPDELSPADLSRHAAELGLDVDDFAEGLRRRRYAPRIARDVQSADASGVSGTPTFFVNGRRHQGVYDVETLTREVKAAARSASRLAGVS